MGRYVGSIDCRGSTSAGRARMVSDPPPTAPTRPPSCGRAPDRKPSRQATTTKRMASRSSGFTRPIVARSGRGCRPGRSVRSCEDRISHERSWTCAGSTACCRFVEGPRGGHRHRAPGGNVAVRVSRRSPGCLPRRRSRRGWCTSLAPHPGSRTSSRAARRSRYKRPPPVRGPPGA